METASTIDQNRDSTLDKLASLDSTFNTQKNFGLMGMIEQAEDKARQTVAEREAPAPKEEKGAEPPDWFGPINTSLQSVRGEFQQGLGHLANELQQLKIARTETQAVDPELSPEIAPVVQKFNTIERNIGNLALRQEWQRAQGALRDARMKYGEKDFNYTDQDLNQIWQKHVAGNPDTAARTEWDKYFATQYIERKAPAVMSENEKLKAEIERLKTGRNNSVQDLYAVPRSNRQTTPARQANDSDFNEELYQRASRKLAKGRFMGMNRALIEEQNRMALSA